MTAAGHVAALLPAHDRARAVTIGETALDSETLFDAGASVAERVRGAPAVAVHAATDVRTVVAVVGCLLAGVPVVPVAPDSGPAERDHVLADSGARILIGPATDGARVDRFEVDLAARSSVSFPEPPPEATAVIAYTSGTTGPPKGALLSRRAVAACLDGLAQAWEWTSDDVLVHGLPLFHVHGLILGVLGGLRAGSPVVHTVRPTPAAYAEAVEQRQGSLLFGVPTVWSRIAADHGSARALRAARLLVSGSAALPPDTADALARSAGQAPVERYGMTETIITIAQRAADARRPGWVGSPLPGVDARLVDEGGEIVPVGDDRPGELQIRGATLFDGYVGRPDPRHPGGWFATGDVAVTDADGRYRIVGRQDTDLIKSGGYRIGAGEIENALVAHADVAEAAVVGVPDPDLGQRIVGYVVSAGPTPPTPEALIDHVASSLSAHKRPREIRFVDALPRNHMGKVLKKSLPTK